jgi:aryl carrier-like protein
MWRDTGMNEGSPFAGAAAHHGFRMIEPGYGIAAFVAALSAEYSTLLIGLDGGNEHIQAALATDHLDTVGTLLAVTAAESTVPATDLAEAVRAQLTRADPATAARCTVAVLPEIPRDAAGRPAARQLRSAARLAAGGTGYQEPQGDLEHRLAGIWGQVLAAPRVGREDSFFHLGGSSLRAMRLLARVNETLGTDYPVRVLYENPTLRQFAGAVAVQG